MGIRKSINFYIIDLAGLVRLNTNMSQQTFSYIVNDIVLAVFFHCGVDARVTSIEYFLFCIVSRNTLQPPSCQPQLL